ncbi:energy transducer TonB [Fluviicola taffensis]|nr:hypothetical protein [Fluviicola taffensis]
MQFTMLILAFCCLSISFGQSIKQQNKQLEVKRDAQKKEADSLFSEDSSLKEASFDLENENIARMKNVLDEYYVTEETKFDFHSLINETNDSLIDWSQFYRYDEVSLEKLEIFQAKLGDPVVVLRLELGIGTFLAERKRMTPKQYNASLRQEISFFERISSDLKSNIIAAKKKLQVHKADSSQIAYWFQLISRTSDYCQKMRNQFPSKTKDGWICGTRDDDEGVKNLFEESETTNEVPYEKMPEFPGGWKVLKQYLTDEVEKAGVKSEDPDRKNVYVKFRINDNGEIMDALIKIAPDCFQCETEIKRIIRHMPRWIPATKGGHPVSTLYHLPIKIN